MPANIVVPEVGESIVDARVAKWLRKAGDVVAVGDALVELETDKIDVEVAAPQGGVLARIDHQDGADVKVGDVLGVIEDASGEAKASETPPSLAVAPSGAKADAKAVAKAEGPRTRATPTAKNAAEQQRVNLSSVKGSGDAGRVMKRDVEAALAVAPKADAAALAPGGERSEPGGVQGTPAASEGERSGASVEARAERRELGGVQGTPPSRKEDRIRMSKRRATIARRLVEAQSTAAMLTTFNEVDMSAVMALRERHKQSFKERHGVSLGIASFFVRASTGALRAFPRINAEIQGDEMVLKRYYDIGVAVGASEGLVVPVLRDADRLSFAEIEQQIRSFAKKAEDGTLTLEDLKGGTFTITNGGVFGSLLSTPILNPPQVGILGLHAIQPRPMAVKSQVEVRPMMYVALTYDHRIVDGSEAVQFLVRIKQLVEDPGALLLD